jgi:hypothetical protein
MNRRRLFVASCIALVTTSMADLSAEASAFG